MTCPKAAALSNNLMVMVKGRLVVSCAWCKYVVLIPPLHPPNKPRKGGTEKQSPSFSVRWRFRSMVTDDECSVVNCYLIALMLDSIMYLATMVHNLLEGRGQGRAKLWSEEVIIFSVG